MKRNLATLVLFFMACGLSAQTSNYWTKKSDFGGLKRERAVGFSINDKGYVGSGVDTSEAVKNDWWEYDAITDVWTQKASIPGSVRRNAIGMAINGKGYVGTGIDSAEAFNGTILKDFWEYNPANNSWSQKADYPGGGGSGVYFATAFSIGGKGFVCCGKIGADSYIDEIWEYKPLTDQWTQRGDFPGGVRYQLSSFVVNDLAYVGLGVDWNIYRKDIWQYDPGSDTWVQKANFAGGERGSASTFSLGERGFVCLGVDGGLKNDLWEYNPYLDSWTARATYDGSARKGAVAFEINGKAYVGTGDGYSGKKASMYEYSPVPILAVDEHVSGSGFNVFPNPVSDHFIITTETVTIKQYELFSIDGNLVMQFNAELSSALRIERRDIASGIYLLLAKGEDGNVTGAKQIIFQ